MTFHPARDWPSERGATLFEASAEIIGGFPGYADRACQLDNTLLRISERFLIADDGSPRGFAIPLGWLEGTTLVAQPNRDDYALRVFYRIEGSPRLFTVRFRANRIGARGPRRSLRAQEVLHETGILDRFASSPPLQPNFTLPWDQTREFEDEQVIWTGRASAPAHVGGELAPSEIWLTTRSLIWGSGSGEGINRIPLPLLMDLVTTRLRDRLGTPVIYVAIGDESTGRYELPFVFDLQTPPDHNFRDRGALLSGLRLRGVADGATAPYHQPWRSSMLSAEPEANDPEPFTWEHSGDHSLEEIEPSAVTEAVATISATDPAPSLWGTEPFRRRGGIAGRILRLPNGPEQDVDDMAPPDEPYEMAPETEAALELEPSASAAEVEIAADSFEHPSEPAEQEDPTERFAFVGRIEIQPIEDVVLAVWSAPAEPNAAPIDVPIAETWSPVDRDGVSADPALAGSVDESVDAPILSDDVVTEPEPFFSPTNEPWAAVQHYEAVAVGGLSEALRVIDDCVAGSCGAPLAEHAPSSWDQARALAELDELVRIGTLSEDDAMRRKERLLALGETCVRLRTLIELQDHGFLSVAELDRKRVALIAALSATLARVAPPDVV